MLLIIIEGLVYLLIAAPVAWLAWHYTAAYPLAARLSVLGALALGMIDGRRRRRARKSETFPHLD